MKTEIKTCSGCAHASLLIRYGEASCFRSSTFDLVHGEQRIKRSCAAERWPLWRWLGFDTCGPEGRYHKPAPPPQPPMTGSGVSGARDPEA